MKLRGSSRFLFPDDKDLVEESVHNLCVKVPFFNAMKGQEVVIHRWN